MNPNAFIQRVVLRNYKSIGHCDVQLRPLTYLVGQNGAGKSNFLDALHFVRDALAGSLDNAINERGGLNEVRRRSSGHPTHFGIRIDFHLKDGREGMYAFDVGAMASGGYEVQHEKCSVGGIGKGPFFRIEKGRLIESSETAFPAITADRLALVAASGFTAFRPVFDALTTMGFYNLNRALKKSAFLAAFSPARKISLQCALQAGSVAAFRSLFAATLTSMARPFHCCHPHSSAQRPVPEYVPLLSGTVPTNCPAESGYRPKNSAAPLREDDPARAA